MWSINLTIANLGVLRYMKKYAKELYSEIKIKQKKIIFKSESKYLSFWGIKNETKYAGMV